MEPQIVYGKWMEIDRNGEVSWCPLEHWDDDILKSLHPCTVVQVEGWGARMSMPGYLDCTEWVIYDTEEKAREFLAEFYGAEV